MSNTWAVCHKQDSIRRYVFKLQSTAFLQHAEQVYRRFDRMCCLHLQGACGIIWGIEKCQPCGIIARTVLSKCRR